MISAGELRNGVTMEYEGEIYSVLEFQHVKPGKGAGFRSYKTEKHQNRCSSGKNIPSY